LVIIIFLVVSATFTRTSELQINLPTSTASTSQEKPLMINVDVDANGKFSVNDKVLADASVAGISAALQAVEKGGKEPTIVINADAKSTHQSVVDVMTASQEAGYAHITFVTK